MGQVTGTHQIQRLSVVRSFSTLTRCEGRNKAVTCPILKCAWYKDVAQAVE